VHSQKEILQFAMMSEACLAVAGVEVCASGGSATVVGLGLDSDGPIIVPSSVCFPSLAATLGVFQLRRNVFAHTWISHNSSSWSNSLFVLFFRLQITFIDFI
jgi:hypothetical protein